MNTPSLLPCRPRLRVCAALLASACLHAALFGALYGMGRLARQERLVPAVARSAGTMTIVRFGDEPVRRPALAPSWRPPSAEPTARRAAPSPAKPVSDLAAMRASPADTSPDEPPPPPSAPPSAPQAGASPAPQASRAAGARYASLFAPVLQAPLGQSRWGRRPATFAPPPQTQADGWQAASALRAELEQRLDVLVASARGRGEAIECRIVADALARRGRVDCVREADAGQVWAALQGLITGADQPPAPGNGTWCLRLDDRGRQWVDCAAGPSLPPPRAASVPQLPL